MALPTGTYSDTNLAVFITTVYAKDINVSYDNDLVFAKLFADKSSIAVGTDTIKIANLNSFGAADTKSNATILDVSSTTPDNVTLTVDTWVYKAFMIEDRELAQTSVYDIMGEYSKKAGYSVAAKLESTIAALFASFTNYVGASTADLVESIIRAAIAKARSVNMHKQDLFFVFHTDVVWKQLISPSLNNTFVSMDYTSVSSVDGNGISNPTASVLMPVGKLFGIPVYESNNVPYVSSTTGRINLLATRDAIVFATLNLGRGGLTTNGTEGGYKVRLQADYLTQYLATLVAADMCLGAAINRNTDGAVKIYSKE